jgi:hypothetical protein
MNNNVKIERLSPRVLIVTESVTYRDKIMIYSTPKGNNELFHMMKKEQEQS